MLDIHFKPWALILLALVSGLGSGAQALADDDTKARRPRLPKHQQECAACHVAFPPGMLPASAWARIMDGLDKHYGADASLDEASVREIAGWLRTHAGTSRRLREQPPEDRITRSAWFEREHRKIDPQVWKHASVKSAANCAVCHSGADKGGFDDDLRFPAGLDARYRRAWQQ